MISGNNINLRAIEPYDIELMYTWENDVSIWTVSGTTSPFSRQTMTEFVENARQDIYTNKQLRLGIDLNGDTSERPRTIGYIDLYEFDPTHRRAGVGILIADEVNRRNGYGLEALNLLSEYAFNVINLHQLYCNIQVNNHASIKLFESAGFVRNGELRDWTLSEGNWLNAFMMQKLNPENGQPQP